MDARRFTYAFLFGFLPALVWVFVYFLAVGTAADDWRWFWNNPTFSLHHPFVMPVAFAVAAVAFHLEVLDPRNRTGWKYWVRVAFPFISVVFVSFLVIDDRQSGVPAPYMLAHRQDRARAYELEKELRRDRPRTLDFQAKRKDPGAKPFTEAEDAVYHVKEQQYDRLIHSAPTSRVWFYNTFLTWYYAIFIAFVFSYMLCILLEWLLQRRSGLTAPNRSNAPLAFVVGLLLLWFPLRVHADWFGDWYRNPDGWLTDHIALMFIAALAVVGLVILIAIFYPDNIGSFLTALAAVFGAVAGVVGVLKPEEFNEFAEILDKWRLMHYFGLALITLPILILLGLITMAPPLAPTVPPAPATQSTDSGG